LQTGAWAGGLTRVGDACTPPIKCGFTVQDGVLKGTGTLTNVALELMVAGRQTVDRTGLAGVYRIELLWSPDNAAGLPADAPPEIFTAVREQLGLRLQASTAPTEVLVIDSAARPEEN